MLKPDPDASEAGPWLLGRLGAVAIQSPSVSLCLPSSLSAPPRLPVSPFVSLRLPSYAGCRARTTFLKVLLKL
jgi:hypothetical protein